MTEYRNNQPLTNTHHNQQQYIHQQVSLFEHDLPALLSQYEGRYIAFESGKVLAVGNSRREVLDMVDAQRGYKAPVLVRRVQAEYPPIEL